MQQVQSVHSFLVKLINLFNDAIIMLSKYVQTFEYLVTTARLTSRATESCNFHILNAEKMTLTYTPSRES
jgi:hypothetical protein